MSPQVDTTKYLADPALLAQKLDVDVSDPNLLTVLRRVSNRFRDAVGHPVHRVDDDEVFLSGDGGPALQLPATPVLGDPQITHNGAEVTGVQVGRRSGLLRRVGGWPVGLENIRVVYSHGYDPEDIPGGIEDAVLEMAEIVYTLKYGVGTIASAGDTITFLAAMSAGGTTPAWDDAVSKYSRGSGDQA